MLDSLADVIRALALPVTINYDCPAKPMVSPTNKQIYQGRGSGVVAVNAAYAPALLAKSRKCRLRGSTRKPFVAQFRHFFLVRIKKIVPVQLCEPVYNLEVAGPHDYVVRDVVVHNCNKDKAKSYGLVKWSGFNDPMKRIELIVALNGSSAAADRNGGLVADKELEKLAKDKPIATSMACLVSHDVCSYCGNKAPKRDNYCVGADQGGQCKAGGLRDNIGSLVEIDGGIHHLHADNPDPTFFDISHVYRPADRIAYVTGLLKAAGAHVIGGAELAEVMGVTLPGELLVPAGQPAAVATLFKLAAELAALETRLTSQPELAGYAGAFSTAVQELPPLPAQCREKAGQFLMALADSRCLLPVATFLELFAGQPREKAAMAAELVRQQLPGVYSRLLEQPAFANRLATAAYQPAAAAGPVFRNWVAKQAAVLSVRPAIARSRAMRAAMRDAVSPLDTHYEKRAADTGSAGQLAEEYALYKLAFLGALPATDDEMQLTAAITLLQNYVM
jgi:hypothetical protein